jgi:hypothetical protein
VDEEVEQTVGIGMEKALWISLGLAFLKISSSFMIYILEEKWTFRQLKGWKTLPMPILL